MDEPKTYLDEDGDAQELDDAWFAKAKPGRPALPEAERKQRVTMYLDRDVLERLKADGKGWQTRANEKLREALGL